VTLVDCTVKDISPTVGGEIVGGKTEAQITRLPAANRDWKDFFNRELPACSRQALIIANCIM